jgi:hypothetical protein
MDDARRFLRYLIPGSLFFFQTGLVLFGILPKFAIEKATSIVTLDEGKSVGLALVFLVTSGTVGFLTSMVHHALYWHFPVFCRAVDHRLFIDELNTDGLVTDAPAGETVRELVMSAWVVVTKLWYEHVVSDDHMKDANERARSNSDLIHSLGSCRVSLWAGLVTGLAIGCDRGFGFAFAVEHKPIAGLALLVAVFLLWCSHRSYRQNHDSGTDFVRLVLRGALERRWNETVPRM